MGRGLTCDSEDNLPAQGDRKNWCGRWESNPHEEKSPEDFHAVYGFRRPDADALQHARPVCGLDYPFTVSRKVRDLGAARLVSTPSRLEFFAGLGSGLPLQVSPNLSSSASLVSRRALKFRLSPQRLPFRHARNGWLQHPIIQAAKRNLHVSFRGLKVWRILSFWLIYFLFPLWAA
jgi:hypothetical protein